MNPKSNFLWPHLQFEFDIICSDGSIVDVSVKFWLIKKSVNHQHLEILALLFALYNKEIDIFCWLY